MSTYPYSEARTTGMHNNEALLASILAADTLDEISTSEDFAAVERYIRNQGRVDGTGYTTRGVMFWVYPTGMRGPFHRGSLEDDGEGAAEEEGEVVTHGTLVTIEKGALLRQAISLIRLEFRMRGISHAHIAKHEEEPEGDSN